MIDEAPPSLGSALRSLSTQQAPTIRPERKSSSEIQAEIRAQEQAKLEPLDIVKTVKDGWRTSEFWLVLVGGIAGSLAVAKGWISEAALADLTENLGMPYIIGRSIFKFAPQLLERLKK